MIATNMKAIKSYLHVDIFASKYVENLISEITLLRTLMPIFENRLVKVEHNVL